MSCRQLPLWAVAGCLASVSTAFAQNPTPCPTSSSGQINNPPAPGQAVGPDVVVGDMQDLIAPLGPVGGIMAYSFGTTSCNMGNVPVRWISGTREHPVIGQNMYRIKDGRFEQIGQSWLKHGFTALSGDVCCRCSGGGGSQLMVGCSDPYTASRNANQSGNGPKYAVNANTGFFPYPFTTSNPSIGYTAPPAAPATIGRRLQVPLADTTQGPVGGPNPNAGAIYLIDSHYVTRDDALAGNGLNNLSYRRIQFSPGSNGVSFAGSTVRQKPAIQGWKDLDPTVTVLPLDYAETNTVPLPIGGEPATQTRTSRFWVAAKVTNLGNGQYQYAYAVMNLNSHRSAVGFHVPLGCGVQVSDQYFRDVAYHSGEPFDGADWSKSVTSNAVNWAGTKTYAQDPNANALRWSTTYTFSFVANAAPSTGTVSLDLFRPAVGVGEADTLTLAGIPVPSTGCGAEQDGNAGLTPADVAAFINKWFDSVSNGGVAGDYDCSGDVTPSDVAAYINSWFNAVNGTGC